MSGFPFSARLVALPLWGLLALREGTYGRGGPVLHARIGSRVSMPTPDLLRQVALAPDIRGLHLVIEHVGGGWASLRAIRDALGRIKDAGKPVYIELESCGNAELYLSSVASRVWLRPMGEVGALGIAATMRFAGDALARFGLQFDVEAAGAYKAAGEMFTRAWASGENREATTALVDGLQQELIARVAEGRKLTEAAVASALADGPLSAADAQARGLVDAIAYPDEVHAALEQVFGEGHLVRGLHHWLKRRVARQRVAQWMEGRRQVVVVHLEGPIVDGEGTPGAVVVAAEPACRMVDALWEDDDVAGVVLAVQSPGGSALASDRIWRSVVRLGEKKPVVAVFRDVAASGGYYLAAPAREIFVEPNTITGSIGVVGGKLVIRDALARLGVHSETVGGPDAGMYAPDAPFTPRQRAGFRRSLERFYRGFVERVAAGRKRPYDDVEPLARGRVWTGAQAVANGLADRFGGVHDGVARVRELAGEANLARVDLRVAPRSGRIARLVRGWIGAALPLHLVERLMLSPLTLFLLGGARGPLAVWPYEIDVHD